MLVCLDATLWPANSTYLSSAISAGCAIVNMSEDNALHVQLPQPQSSTSNSTILKHRRALEDSLIGNKLDISNQILLRFAKPDSQKNDSRRMSQNCLCAVSGNFKSAGFAASEVMTACTIGPAPLIKTSAMLGYDQDDGSMSAGLRTEQWLALMKQFPFPLQASLIAAFNLP